MRSFENIDTDYIEKELLVEFPKLKIIAKENDPLSRWIDRALRVITFGAQKAYMTSYATTLGYRIYTPSSWMDRDPRSRYVTLRHEAVHLRQFRRYTLIGASLFYALPILPFGLAYGRMHMEWEAYKESIIVSAELYGIQHVKSEMYRNYIVSQFTSGAYGWMWPFPKQMHRRVQDVIDELEAGKLD